MSRRFPDYSLPFSEFYKDKQDLLFKKLLNSGISNKTAGDVISSGYYMLEESGLVYDSFYAPMWLMTGQFRFNDFLEILENRKTIKSVEKKISTVHSTEEILDILRSDPHSNYCLDQGSLSYRGQTNEYFTKRLIPNPSLKNKEGQERLIIPGIYRKYSEDFQARIMDERPQEIFNTYLADDLIYYGMESPLILQERNYKKYGIHTISDLGDFPEPENQEFYKRWIQIKVQGNAYPDIAIISQHYGFHTYGLDITFDPKVAAFFASHKFVLKSNGKADYYPVEKGKHTGVIYCFYFRAPQITRTKDIIQSIPAFDYIKPVRPIKQSCALPFFLPDRLNEANQFIFHIFKLHPDFDNSDLPSKNYLFPNMNEDKFYKAVIDVKKNNDVWSDFVEYDF
ncbi:MAG: FRG domain-containing protein [Chitinophagales bacterium]|nr:FRG domain-containing protein [Chitinophagales bacterium]